MRSGGRHRVPGGIVVELFAPCLGSPGALNSGAGPVDRGNTRHRRATPEGRDSDQAIRGATVAAESTGYCDDFDGRRLCGCGVHRVAVADPAIAAEARNDARGTWFVLGPAGVYHNRPPPACR